LNKTVVAVSLHRQVVRGSKSNWRHVHHSKIFK